MKIQTGYQQPPIVQRPVDNAAERISSAASPQKAAAKPSKPQDIVDLSAKLDIVSKQQQAEQAARVESIKSRVNAGKYEVSSQLVAEKMLHGSSS